MTAASAKALGLLERGLPGAWLHSLVLCNDLTTNLAWLAPSSNSSHCFPEDFLPETLLLRPLVEAMKRSTKNKQPPPDKIRYQKTKLQRHKVDGKQKAFDQCYLNRMAQPWERVHFPPLPISNHRQEQAPMCPHTFMSISECCQNASYQSQRQTAPCFGKHLLITQPRREIFILESTFYSSGYFPALNNWTVV